MKTEIASTEALVPTISEETRMRLMLAIAVPKAEEESKGIVEVVQELGLATADVVALLNEPGFMKGVRAITKAQANLALHGEGIKTLIDISRTGNDREKLTALKLIGQITGDTRAGVSVEVKVTFDDLRKRRSDDPLSGLFDIGGVIEAEIAEGEEEDGN